MSEILIRVATEFDVVKVKIGKEASARVERLQAVQPHGACLGCERPFEANQEIRCGMCSTCYNGALYAISKRRTTRVELIRLGRMLPATKGGRKPANSFTKSLSDL